MESLQVTNKKNDNKKNWKKGNGMTAKFVQKLIRSL